MFVWVGVCVCGERVGGGGGGGAGRADTRETYSNGGGGGGAGARVDAALGHDAPQDEGVRFPPPALFQRSGVLMGKNLQVEKNKNDRNSQMISAVREFAIVHILFQNISYV